MSALTVAPASPPRHQPYAELVTVTPALAEKWLGKNTRNRNVRQSKVATYADEMASGDWLVTGDGPKFDVTGRLINGQHTLMAVIASGRSVEMFVFRGLHPDAQLVMDTGTKRSAADALKFSGIEGANLIVLASMARVGINWETGRYKLASRPNANHEVTHTETIAWVRENPDSVAAANMADQFRKSLPMPPTVVGFTFLLFSRIDADAAYEFFLSLSELRTQGKGDPLFTVLRRYRLAAERDERLRTAQHLFFLIRTWNAWRRQEPLHQLKVNLTGEGPGGAIRIPEVV